MDGNEGTASLGFPLIEGVVGLAVIVGRLGVWGREGGLAVVVLRSARVVVRASELGVVVRSGRVVAAFFAGPSRLDDAVEVALLAQPAERGRP